MPIPKTEIKLSKGYITMFLQSRRQEIMFIDKESTAAIEQAQLKLHTLPTQFCRSISQTAKR
jgi:hypothetical protein